MPKISVIVPVYNVDKYLRKCLDSIVNQTFTDMEIICINDGSTDKSLNILEEYASKDNRIIIINQENQGQGVARNRGIDAASGEYISFIDSDDFIELDMLETIYNKIKQTGVDVVQFDYQMCDEDDKFIEYNTLSVEIKKRLKIQLKNEQIFSLKDFKRPNFVQDRLMVWDKIYSSDFIKRNNIRHSPTKIGEDHLLSIGSTILANKILYTNQYFYHYRRRSDSSVHIISGDNLGVFDNIEYLKEFLVSHNLYNTYKKAFINYCIDSCATQYYMLPEECCTQFKKRCKELFNKKEYKCFLQKTMPKYNFWQRIFSIRNYRRHGIKYKYLCVFGISFVIEKKEENKCLQYQ